MLSLQNDPPFKTDREYAIFVEDQLIEANAKIVELTLEIQTLNAQIEFLKNQNREYTEINGKYALLSAEHSDTLQRLQDATSRVEDLEKRQNGKPVPTTKKEDPMAMLHRLARGSKLYAALHPISGPQTEIVTKKLTELV